MKKWIKEYIDQLLDNGIIKHDPFSSIIYIYNPGNQSNDIIIDQYDTKIKVLEQIYLEDVRNYVINKIKDLILSEIITDKEIYIKKETYHKTILFKRRQYIINYQLMSNQFNRSPIIERATLFIETNRFINKVIKAHINYEFLTIPISINNLKIKFI